MQIEVVRGARADALLADGQFTADWARLYAACPWATVMQSYAFADAWYTTYRERFEPVLVTSRDVRGRLGGLLALAHSPSSGLVPAGGHQAEYQCWISAPEHGDAFARGALRAVRESFPSLPLTFRYLPPCVPLGWLRESPDLTRVSMLTPWRRPLARLDRQSIEQWFKRRNIRSRLNKLNRMGCLGIERITDVVRWERMFDQFIAYHDLRRLAVGGSAPFADDPLKKPFHLELMRRDNLLCVTVLRMGDEIISAQLDLIGRGEVHLALGAYAPWVSKHAVGKIHVAQVGRLLMESGCERMDLTPGDDPYKSDFANEWDTVQVMTCYPNAAARQAAGLGRTVERIGRSVLRKLNVKPAQVRGLVLGELRRRPAATVLAAGRAVREQVGSSRQTLVYARALDEGGLAPGPDDSLPPLRRNAVADLMAYRPRTSEMAVHAYMSQASRRYAESMSSYSSADGGELRFVGWVSDQPAAVLGEGARVALSLPARCGVVFDARAHQGATPELFERAMRQLVWEAARAGLGTDTVLVVVPRRDAAQCRLVERTGFVQVGTAIKSVRLGRERSFGSAAPTPVSSAGQPKGAARGGAQASALGTSAAALALLCHLEAGEPMHREDDLHHVVSDLQESWS